ncbi:unnamed protein product [Cylicostephanus goldi]|uniref:ENTH domain-containing protein n=1 Tax=Cylicostephanus goldi TaxID=71465 RepID=A0A3P6RS75_CYLGO|nr:unnamed protein product [Cylicostephanus goldi]
MSISTIRRQVKNVAYNFSDAQVKVREATCNDPWGPSTALMSEISDLTNNPMAFTEVMSIIWKRLNDSGKNWRHVYKSLVLLDFLIKCGNDKVSQQCRENIFTIETLKDFQHIEDNRDQGLNIREKAKQITALLTDEERLKNERTRFMLTRTKSVFLLYLTSTNKAHIFMLMQTSNYLHSVHTFFCVFAIIGGS